MSYTQLSADERLELYRLRQTGGLSLRAIATCMGRSHSTISRELKRNQSPEQIYLPDSAQAQQKARRQQSKQPFVGISEICLARVKAQLRQYHSPEQIAGSLKLKGLEWVSHETIYQMIYQNHADMGAYRGYLRHSRIQRQHRSAKRQKRGLIPNRVGIEQRPEIAEQKSEIGHWEGDTIIGGNHLGAIATHVDKASKFLVARVMKDRTAAEMNRVTIAAFESIPKEQRRTMTFDNGKEFSKHEQLAATLGVQCYFANPYHSWERGLNEHTNGLIRQFFPKGTNFRIVKQHEVDKVIELINHRPRKSLGYRTPHEVFWGQSGDGALQI
jgi:transposase, IS30 family